MRLIDELRAEHTLIDRALGSFRTWVEQGGEPADGLRFFDFFRRYAGDFHHAREEDSLFVSLQRDAELPLDRGPLAVLTADHRRLGAVLEQLEPLLREVTRGERLTALAIEYSRGLWLHLDAENSVMLPEAEERLRRINVLELPSRAPTAEEHAALLKGQALVARYPQFVDTVVMRGDGCIMCPAYGVSCRGLEREWWSDSEWSEHGDRMSGD
jgi:hemerythrin-like domain-containing protein